MTVPVALYLVTVWWLHLRPHDSGTPVARQHTVVLLVGVALVLLSTFAPYPVLLAGLVTAATVGVAQRLDLRATD